MISRNVPWGIHTVFDMFGAGRVDNPQMGMPDGRWVRAVAEPYTGNRLVAAWWVLTGHAYAVVWPQPGDLEELLPQPESERPERPRYKQAGG